MCGIAGIVDYERPGAANAARAERLCEALRHRGPDGRGTWIGSHAALAHVRLALLDRAGGAQPFAGADGRLTLVFNGEIYDHLALRKRLRYPFRTRSDTETLLAACAEWGEDAARHLNGMFAYFCWDERLQRGFGARDRLGVKPLFAAVDRERGEFRFASEPKALVRDRGPARADREALLEVLAAPCYSGVERCSFAGIEPVPPGCSFTIDREGMRVRRYFAWPAAPAAPVGAADAEALRVELAARLACAVRRAAAADEDVGLFLSGGLDSTALAALAGREPGRPPRRAFSVAFEGQESFDYARSRLVLCDDLPFARAAARDLGLALAEVEVPRADLPEDLRALAAADDQVPAWEQQRAQHRLARAAALAGVKAALVGDAADETHLGYHFLLDADALADPAHVLGRFGPVPVLRDVDPRPVARLAARYRAGVEEAGGGFDGWRARVAASNWLVVTRWLPRLLWNGDVHTMAHGVEARVPFADVELLDLAARVPPELALEGGVEKALLRAALAGTVPDAILYRRKSALPKDQAAAPALAREFARVRAEPHPVVAALVDLGALAASADAAGAKPAEELCAALFRTVALQRWACHHEVLAP